MTVNAVRRSRRRTPQTQSEPIVAPTESISIGEINQTVFDCPTCSRPLALGVRRCPGCGTRLVFGVALRKATLLGSLGLAVGLAAGSAIGFGLGFSRANAAAPVLTAAASPSHGPTASSAPTPSSTPTTAPTVTPAPADPMPALTRSSLQQAIGVNDRLRTNAQALRAALSARTFDPSAVAAILRTMSADTVFGQQLVASLADWPSSAAVAEHLDALYGRVHDAATNGLNASVRDAAAYRAAAGAVLKILAGLPAASAEANALATTVGLDLSASPAP